MFYNTNIVLFVRKVKNSFYFLRLLVKIHINIKKYNLEVKTKIENLDNKLYS